MAIDDDNESSTMGTFVLCLRLDGTEPPNGTIRALGAPMAQQFYGWIELMSAINTLRGWKSLEPSEHLPSEAPIPDAVMEDHRNAHGAFDL